MSNRDIQRRIIHTLEALHLDAYGNLYYPKKDGIYCFDGTASRLMEGIQSVAGDYSGYIFAYTKDGEFLPLNGANESGD